MIVYLFKIEGIIYTVVEGELVSLGTGEVTPQLFTSHGVSVLPYDIIKETPLLEVLAFTTQPEVVGWQLEVTRLWKPQIVRQKFDFVSTNGGVVKIDAIEPTSAKIRILVSRDSGESWEILDRSGGGTSVDIAEISTKGMSVTNINELAAVAWKTYTAESKKFRLAFYLEQTVPSEKLKINYIRFSYLQ